jgi:hypothetical protein
MRSGPEHGSCANDDARHFVALAFKPRRSRTRPGSPPDIPIPALPIDCRKRAVSLIRMGQTQ